MSDPRVLRFREAVVRIRRSRRGVAFRCPAPWRAEAVAIARSEGKPLRRTAEALGVSHETLRRWIQREGAVRFRPVEVVTGEASGAGPVVVSPGGYRVEGLDVAGVAQLLRSLA